MITESLREKMYQEVEKGYPVRPVRNLARQPANVANNNDIPLSQKWQQEFNALKEQLLTQLLFQLHTIFDFSAGDHEVRRIAREAVEHVYELEEACCSKDGSYDATDFALTLLRKHWHNNVDDHSPSFLSGLAHLDQAGFFRKVPQEISTWAKRFLMIERYHRLDARESENRLDRYRLLRTEQKQGIPLGLQFEDLVLWLEFRLLEESSTKAKDIDLLSHDAAKELEGDVSADVLRGDPLQPLVFILLKCHQFCLSETIEASEQRRLEQLFATRQLDSLVDLMRVLIHRITREHRLPDIGMILDQLQSDGFNIDHQGFKDPYEAGLIPISDTECLENARLPIFFPLETLSGDFASDLDLSRRELLDWQRSIVSEIIRDCEAYKLALVQPLPKANLIHRLIRFSVSWVLAQSPWPVANPGKDFQNVVRNMLSENVVRQLVRPRKGYEISSRQELSQLIEAECFRQREALERIASSNRILGYHDYTHFTRYVSFQQIREAQTEEPRNIHMIDVKFLEKVVQPEWVSRIAWKWGIKTKHVHPHSLERVQKYIMDIVAQENMRWELESRFEASGNELNRIYNRVLEYNTPVFHLLLVAYGRHRANLPRVSASPAHIPGMVQLLIAPLANLKKAASDRLKNDFDRTGISIYRNQLRPYLLNTREWKAYIAWKTLRHTKDDVRHFSENRDLDGLLSRLEEDAENLDLSPDALTFDTVRSTLLELFMPSNGDEPVSDNEVHEVLSLLPQLDCAACGQTSCRDFARSLLKGRVEPRGCVQLASDRLSAVVERLSTFKKTLDGAHAVSIFDLLKNRNLWRSSPDKEAIQNALSVRVQKARRVFVEQLRDLWENLSPKPQIFKRPDPETVYREFCRYMGSEATERLRPEERAYLIQHGDERQKAEWQALKQRQDWLVVGNRNRQSGPMLQTLDPRWLATLTYGNVFFLHQLEPRDRTLVLKYRLDQHLDGFSHWWNEDLLTMNLPDFSIRDWEDFSKVIKNAYWHQESSPAAEDALSILESEVIIERNLPFILNALLGHWMQIERARLTEGKNRLDSFREGPSRATINNLDDLRVVVDSMVEEAGSMELSLPANKSKSCKIPIPMEDRLAVEQAAIWEKFQNENFAFSPDFSCFGEELLPTEKEALKKQPSHGNISEEHSASSRHDAHIKDSSPIISGWGESIEKRSALILAVISAALEKEYQEQVEYEWLKKVDHSLLLPLGSLRILIRQSLRMGKNPETIEAELREDFTSKPDLARKVVKEALLQVILSRQYELLRRSKEDISAIMNDPIVVEPVLDGLPELKAVLDRLLERQKTMDRERLLHYLFLLAKMEGNLDTLTALLREIRETADMIEAAWLRFTQERVMEGPGPKIAAGTSIGIPLLASRIKDKEPVNRGLREGLSRKEKKNVTAAVSELLNIVRYHVLVFVDSRGSSGDFKDIIKDIENAGYDLHGIEEEALQTAVKRQWDRRDQLRDQKIWIYTSVTARMLAAQHFELQEAERDFYKIRQDILKVDYDDNPDYLEIATRRGIALDHIKEEMYRRLSDLLESERIVSFQKRIRQIVDQLDQKREEIHAGWLSGQINRRTLFYILRQYQKRDMDPTWEDFERFMRDHWFTPLAELRSSRRSDKEERIRHLDARFRSLLGTSLLELEAASMTHADQHIGEWMKEQLEGLESRLS